MFRRRALRVGANNVRRGILGVMFETSEVNESFVLVDEHVLVDWNSQKALTLALHQLRTQCEEVELELM